MVELPDALTRIRRQLIFGNHVGAALPFRQIVGAGPV